jgi:DNA polymerase III epsilon subunit-like protein
LGSVCAAEHDTHTTGPDAKRDLHVTIGAVRLRDGQIDQSNTFDAMLGITRNRAGVTAHGMTP